VMYWRNLCFLVAHEKDLVGASGRLCRTTTMAASHNEQVLDCFFLVAYKTNLAGASGKAEHDNHHDCFPTTRSHMACLGVV
jgi:hypothetical protein